MKSKYGQILVLNCYIICFKFDNLWAKWKLITKCLETGLGKNAFLHTQ